MLDKVKLAHHLRWYGVHLQKTLDKVKIGTSLFDEDGSKKVAELVEKAKKNNVELVFPSTTSPPTSSTRTLRPVRPLTPTAFRWLDGS